MIARRVERCDALSRNIGHHSLKTPQIAGYQGKNPWVLGYEARPPEEGEKYFLRRAKKPDNPWFGFSY
jgi:hypothetical protein